MPDLVADLAAIRARCEAATPGPWCFPESMKWMRQIFRQADVDKVAHPQSGCPDHALATVHLQYCKDHSYPWEANAQFLAHARADLPLLLARLEEMREVVLDLTHGQADLHKQRGTAPLCDWCGFGWPCAYKVAAEALRPLREPG